MRETSGLELALTITLREVDLEHSPKRGIDKINMEKQGRKTQNKASHIVHPGLTYGSQHLER